jgi:hypothetical protein
MKSYGTTGGFGDTIKSASNYVPRCYESHPPLPLGDGIVIYGGSCNYPAVKDADVYIGFDYGMERQVKGWPWETQNSERVEVYFPVVDMSVPKSVSDFKNLIDWTIEQLKAGKKVHAGCIGGHGRTGTFFSALVRVMMDEKDSTAYVRKHYCHKAVESSQQVEWLAKHFDVTPAKGAKEDMFDDGGSYGKSGKGKKSTHSGVGHSLMPGKGSFMSGKSQQFQHVVSKKSMWGNSGN